jgi:hypothetical protein
MGQILGNWRTISAVSFAFVLIAGSYLFTKGIEFPNVAQASTEAALLQAIATKDSDSDGLPDWQEALYGTDPHKTDSLNLGITDGDAVAKGLIVPKAIADVAGTPSSAPLDTTVDYASEGLTPPSPNTLTDAFAKTFFTLYLSAKETNGGNDLTSDQTTSIAEQAMTQFAQTITPTADFKETADIKISGRGPDALRTYAISAEAILLKNKTDATMSEVEYLGRAIESGDPSASVHLAALAKAYRNTAVGLAALPVPEEIASQMLSIINAVMRLGAIDDDFSRANEDPLTAMLALQQYPPTELSAEHAFAALADTYTANGVVLPNGTPGASFVNIIPNLTAAAQAANHE